MSANLICAGEDMKRPRTYRKCAQRGVELSDKIAKHSSSRTERNVFGITYSVRRCLALHEFRLERICERTAAV